ncbi:winged helix-turn-helix domain-containing protein [Streptomyces sp. NPDC058637]|uniref:helix-turn-helix domain-containing protein n=1 Tax=Streptomyces sp. NPDC058637 TaxID=3346569 RepID=UPI00364E4C5B
MDAGPGEDADRAVFHVSYTVEGTWWLLKRHGWSWQQPARRAIERDDEAVELWKTEVWITQLTARIEELGRAVEEVGSPDGCLWICPSRRGLCRETALSYSVATACADIRGRE